MHILTVSLILNVGLSIFVALVTAFLYRFWSRWRGKEPVPQEFLATCWATFSVVFFLFLFSGYLNPRFEIAPQGTWANWLLKGFYPLVAVALGVGVYRWFIRRQVRLLGWGGGLAAATLALSLGLIPTLFGVVAEPFRGQTWRKVDSAMADAPNIILILLDTLRADHLNDYGYKRHTSPELSRISKRGIVFENAFSHSNWTPPSTATLLTSLYESVHGVNQVKGYVPDGATTLAEGLTSAGYTAAFWSANALVNATNNYTQGFDYVSQISEAYQQIRGQNRLPPYQLYVWRTLSARFPKVFEGLDAVSVFFEYLFNEVGVDRKNPTEVDEKIWSRPIMSWAGYYRARKADWIHKQVQAYVSYMLDRPAYDSRQNKFFLYLHYFDPHTPYRAPGNFKRMFDPGFKGRLVDHNPGGKKMCRETKKKTRQSRCYVEKPPPRGGSPLRQKELHNMVAQYDGEILFLDHFLGQLVQFLKKKDLFENTLLVVTSDHGEAFHEHGAYGHGSTVYQEEVHVPMIVTWPRKLPQGIRRSDPVGLVDVMPTLLEAAGVPSVPSCMQGRSFLKVMTGGERRREVYGETGHHERSSHLFLIRENWKLIYRLNWPISPARSYILRKKFLFDLEADPGEQLNLLELPHANAFLEKMAGSMERSLDRWFGNVRGACRTYEPTESDSTMPTDLQDRLKALGYVE